MMPQTMFPLCKRGIFGLQSWEPQRKPDYVQKQKPLTSNSSLSNGRNDNSSQDTTSRQQNHNNEPRTEPKKLLAKYSYTANPNSPLGKEMTMKQGDKFTLCSDSHDLWWLVKDTEGNVGYAPATYLMVQEPVVGLPWLQNQPNPETQLNGPMTTAFGRPVTKSVGTAKPYQSAYNRQPTSVDPDKYHCEICNKTLNGPKPYSAHMNSRAHREEVEYAKETGRL